jgi:hypothetical protein
MIRTLQLGEKSPNVTEVIFESGDIMMTRIQYESGTFTLALNEHPRQPIGSTTNEYKGKTTDDFPNEIKVALSFKNPKSLNALIHSLVELQKDLFDGNVS